MCFFKSYPNLSRLLLYVALILIALFLPDFLPFPEGMKEVFPFIGLTLVRAANWILYKTENRSPKNPMGGVSGKLHQWMFKKKPFGSILKWKEAKNMVKTVN